MTDVSNVVVLQPRASKVPALRYVELRLIDETCDLEMTLHDADGNIVANIAYDLAFKPKEFDLDLLRAAWAEWRGGTAAAS
jgi:hypothetical protein